MREVVIVGAARTPVGKFGGRLKDISSSELGSLVITESLKRAGVKPEDVNEVIMGNVLGGGAGQNPARQSAVKAGIPYSVASMTVNKVCGSGLKAVNLGALSVASGELEIVVAGGMESMSMAPFFLRDARWGYRLGNGRLIDGLINDGLWDVFNDCHMGVLVDMMAEKYKVSRREQDSFALASQMKTKKAQEEGRFRDEIVPVAVRNGEIIVDEDEFPRHDTTMEKLAGLKPAFKKDGTLTAGNSSGINDGAAAVVITSLNRVKEMNLSPMARIVSYASCGVDPKLMGIGPLNATRKALEKANLSLKDIDLIELNEAFAAQSLIVIRELGLNEERVNVNGGAIALGHPIGASGARILVTLLYELQRQKKRFGLATLCIGGGMGIATIIERI
jgi:acetyl-CoA C-acetyltransferase